MVIVPSLKHNYLSFKRICKQVVFTSFETDSAQFKSSTWNWSFPLVQDDEIIEDAFFIDNEFNFMQQIDAKTSDALKQHFWLEHSSPAAINQMKRLNIQHKFHKVLECFCWSAINSQRLPSPGKSKLPGDSSISKHALLWFHLDTAEFPTSSVHEYRYFTVFVDDFTSFIWVALFRKTSDIEAGLVEFLLDIEKQLQQEILIFKSDKGTDFVNNALLSWMTIKHIQKNSLHVINFIKMGWRKVMSNG